MFCTFTISIKIKQTMAKTFGILVSGSHTTFTGATSATQIVPLFIRKVIEAEDGINIPTGGLKLAVQNYVDGYGEAVVENQLNDYGEVQYPVISIEEVADHLMNQGWITVNRKSIDNRLVAQMIHTWMKEKDIEDYDGTHQMDNTLAPLEKINL
jgi:hypothetical protein